MNELFILHVMDSNPPKDSGQLSINVRFGSGLHDAGHKGVATRRCVFSLCSPSSAGKSVPLNEVSLYLRKEDLEVLLNGR